jgi:DNA modification methylase
VIGLNRVLVGDAKETLRRLPAALVDCVVTSPPYFRLRDYQHPGQLGLEAHIDEWVEGLRSVLAEVARALVPTGTVWLNLGDSYSRGKQGAPFKSLLLGPDRLALGLIADGWIVRNKIVWAKRNPLPTAARDRLSGTWEVVYLLTRQPDYFFDLDAVRVPHTSRRKPQTKGAAWSVPLQWRVTAAANEGLTALSRAGLSGHPLGKNPGDVWNLATSAYRSAHHAVFPASLVETPIKAGSPERRCTRCRLPWKRPTAKQLGHLAVRGELAPTCRCGAAWEPGVVLDPFIGSGTTAVVAEKQGRNWLGIELNPEFAALAEQRIAAARQKARSDERRAA